MITNLLQVAYMYIFAVCKVSALFIFSLALSVTLLLLLTVVHGAHHAGITGV